MNRDKRVLSNTITTNRSSNCSVEGVFGKEFLYSVISSGGLLFCAVVRFVKMIKSDWLFDARYDWYRSFVIYLIVLLTAFALSIIISPENKWFNVPLASLVVFWEYEVVLDYDIAWYNFRIMLFNITILLMILSTKIFWTRLIIIVSRLVWMALWVAYTVVFIYLLLGRNIFIAFLYMCLVTLMLINMTQSLETFKIFSTITSKISLLPSVLILLCPICAVSTNPSASIIIDLVEWFPMLLLSVSCYCFCKYLSINRQEKRTLSLKKGVGKALAITSFILLAIVYCEIYRSVCSA